MFLSVSDVFKIGIGPSSSHTVGPMVAASRFITKLHKLYDLNEVKQIQVSLHGSLAFTGKGHGSDRAIILGLLGKTPETLDPNSTNKVIEKTQKDRFIEISKTQKINFNPSKDIIFDFEKVLPGHANAMVFYAIEKKIISFLKKLITPLVVASLLTQRNLKACIIRGIPMTTLLFRSLSKMPKKCWQWVRVAASLLQK